eukprot:gene5796-8000_t
MINDYTLNGSIPIERFYVDDTNDGSLTHFIYSAKSLESFISGASKLFNRIEVASNSFSSLKKDQWVHYAMYHYRNFINGSQVCVFGSAEPWVEAAAIALGAANITTIEYNNLTYNHPSIKTISKYQFEEFYTSSFLCDISFSISAFDHDGLGRYGDTLAPQGDLLAMKSVKSKLIIGGLLFLTVPIGPDVVVFNLHRRYGKIRLPYLLSGWEVVEKIAWNEQRISQDANWRQTYEPVFVLKKPMEGELIVEF